MDTSRLFEALPGHVYLDQGGWVWLHLGRGTLLSVDGPWQALTGPLWVSVGRAYDPGHAENYAELLPSLLAPVDGVLTLDPRTVANHGLGLSVMVNDHVGALTDLCTALDLAPGAALAVEVPNAGTPVFRPDGSGVFMPHVLAGGAPTRHLTLLLDA